MSKMTLYYKSLYQLAKTTAIYSQLIGRIFFKVSTAGLLVIIDPELLISGWFQRQSLYYLYGSMEQIYSGMDFREKRDSSYIRSAI